MKRFLCLLLACPCLLLFAGAAQGENLRVGLEGNAGFLWLISEQNENGILQPGSMDQASQEASGFAFRQGRLAFLFRAEELNLEAVMRFKLEEQTGILDFYGGWTPAQEFKIYFGQMKIPSTAEVLIRDHMIDFISRSTFGRSVGDYAMARTPYISPFLGTGANNRGLGVAFKGSFGDEQAPWLSYFFMVSNGLGGNRYIGGKDKTEFIHANDFGDYYYGLRLESMPVSWLTAGAHYSLNRHDEAIYQDKKSVVDLDRTVWTADFKVVLPRGTRVQGFYGDGGVDDFWTAQEYVYDYSGWGLWVMQELFNKQLELGARYDTFITEFQKDDDQTEQNNWTFGANWRPNPCLRLQLNYVWKDTVNEFVDDLDDDILYLNVQFMFDAWLYTGVNTPGRS